MKIKSLLVLGLAGIALTGCNNLKGYKTEVLQATFKSDLEKAFNASTLFNVKNPYSFVMKTESTYDMNVYHTKENKTFVEEKKSQKTTGIEEYDSVLNMSHSKSKDELNKKIGTEESRYKFDSEYLSQADSANKYLIDMKTRLYTKELDSKASQNMKDDAASTINMPVDLFLDEDFGIAVVEDSGSKFYIDKNVYTCVNIIDSTKNGTHDYIKTTWQLILLNDGFDFYYTVSRQKEELNEKLLLESFDFTSLRRKDDLKLKTIDLHNYLEVDLLPVVEDL